MFVCDSILRLSSLGSVGSIIQVETHHDTNNMIIARLCTILVVVSEFCVHKKSGASEFRNAGARAHINVARRALRCVAKACNRQQTEPRESRGEIVKYRYIVYLGHIRAMRAARAKRPVTKSVHTACKCVATTNWRLVRIYTMVYSQYTVSKPLFQSAPECVRLRVACAF